MPANENESVPYEEYEKNRRGNVGRCIHWSGVGCTFPDEEASLCQGQDPGYYEGVCPRKDGTGCKIGGYFHDMEVA